MRHALEPLQRFPPFDPRPTGRWEGLRFILDPPVPDEHGPEMVWEEIAGLTDNVERATHPEGRSSPAKDATTDARHGRCVTEAPTAIGSGGGDGAW